MQDELWPPLEIPFWHVYVMCKRRAYYNALWLFATASPPFSSHISPRTPLPSPRLEECSSEVPLLPREVLVFLSTKLWDSSAHLAGVAEHNSSTPQPLLLIKFFIIVCRWGPSQLCICFIIIVLHSRAVVIMIICCRSGLVYTSPVTCHLTFKHIVLKLLFNL